MKAILIGGSHPRHLYYLNAIAASPHVEVVGTVIQKRGVMLPLPPVDISEHDKSLWLWHFIMRNAKELEFFGAQEAPEDAAVILPSILNAPMIADHVRSLNADVAFIFGCGMIREPLMSALPLLALNLHLGLSPRYRGAASMFWPLYFLEPNWCGCTVHQIVDEPDAGAILHQSVPPLLRGDTTHDVSCRAVKTVTAEMLQVLGNFETWKLRPQKNTGKCFLASDFQAAHLRTVYDTWNDAIVDAYLDGIIRPPAPRLYQENLR